MTKSLTQQRIHSIDILRGLVMVIMAIDHIRDFLHNDAVLHDPLNIQTTTPALFFTRWITHFCAPIFVFLSGLSAGLSRHKRSAAQTSSFLIKRGLWLIVVEVLVITLGLSFNPLYNMLFLQVIWAIGCSMIILGLLLKLSAKLVLPIGLLLIVGHDVLNYLPPVKSPFEAGLLQVLFTARFYVLPLSGNHMIIFLYAILPWTGIMLLGYAVSAIYQPSYNQQRRRAQLLYSGLGLLAFFILLRFTNTYGEPQHWSVQSNAVRTFLSFINVSKYPPSLLYTCLTLSFALIFLSATELTNNVCSRILTVYGKVPFFYYVLHFFILHTVTVIVFYVSGYTQKDIVTPNYPFLFRPATLGFSLGIVYLIWLGIVASLYWPCKWYIGYKQRHQDQWWVSYL
jgi:uncharacterized membrane protein